MSLTRAQELIRQGLTGVSSPVKPLPSLSSMGSSSASDSLSDVGENLMSPVPKEVKKGIGFTTYTLPDGRQFRLDDRGRPVVSERGLTTKEKDTKRSGSFQESQEEVDHRVPMSLGGTDDPGNLQALKSNKTISQTVWDFVSGKERLPGEYKPENRQEGKMIVEWKALDKYEAGEITLFEAMAAVQNYDNKELVADFLHEEPEEKTLLQKAAEFMQPDAGGVTGRAVDFIKGKVKESQRTGALNKILPLVGGAKYRDLEDGRALIAKVGEGLDQQQAQRAEEVVRETRGVFESPFLAKPVQQQAGLIVTAPVRLTLGSAAHWLGGVGLEVMESDAKFTPTTNLQSFLLGKEDIIRTFKSEDIYGTAANLVQKKLEEKGISHDNAHAAGLTSVILFGAILENPFFAVEKAPAKKALQEVLKQSLERELGGELSERVLKDIAFEAERIVALKSETAKTSVVKDLIQKIKADPEALRVGAKEADSTAVKPLLSERELELDAKKRRMANEVSLPRSVSEFNKLTVDEQTAVFDDLPLAMKKKIYGDVDYEGVGLTDVDMLVDDLLAGRTKVQIPKVGKEDIMSAIGPGRYAKIYKEGSTFSALDELATTVGVTENELLDAIARGSSRSKMKSANLAPSKTKLAGTTEKQVLPSKIGPSRTPASVVPSYEDTVARAPVDVKKKVNILDEFGRTPNRVLEKIGFGEEAKLLRRSYDAYAKELPKNIDKVTEWAGRVPKESNTKIFQYLDGKKVDLDEAEKQVATEIQAWLSTWADRLGLPEDKRIASYITHVFDEELIAKEFDEDLAKIIANKLPGEVYDPFLEKRLGAQGYKEDTWAALDAYAKRATRKVHMDPALTAVREKAGKSLETSKIEQSQFEYLKNYTDKINMRPSQLDTSIDNFIKASFIGYKFGQRPVTGLAKFLRQATFRGMLGLNPGSALRNLSQGINTYAVLGEKYTMLGYTKLFNAGAMRELEEEGILSAGFIQDRKLNATKKLVEKMDKVLFAFFDTAERINRGAAYFGAKSKALSEGKPLAEAIEYGKEIVRKTQFVFDPIDTPPKLAGDIAKTFTQFQTYTVKQVEFLTEMAADKNFVGLARYAMAGTLFVTTVGQAFGMEPRDLIPMFRVGTPPSIKLPVEIGKAALDAPDKFGQKRSASEKLADVADAGIGLIPAGSQIKKTLEGKKAIEEGGSYTKSGKLQFEQGQSTAEKAQALLFGKYASPEADAYFEGTAPSASELRYKEIMDMPSKDRADAFSELKEENPSLASQVRKVAEDAKSGITEEEKVIRALGVQDNARAEAIVEALNALETKEEKAALWNDYVDKKILTSEVKKQVVELLK